MKKVVAHIEGIRPIIMHNGQTADPLNEFAKALKKLSGKRNKTESDHEAMAEVEWDAGLYWDDDIGVYLPCENVFTAFQEACKKIKMGRQSIALLVDHDVGVPLEFPKHKDRDAMKADKAYTFRKVVKVGQSKVARTRPRIPAGWKASIHGLLDTDIMDSETFEQIMHICGNVVGYGDWRPSSPKPGTYGRFMVHSVEVSNV